MAFALFAQISAPAAFAIENTDENLTDENLEATSVDSADDATDDTNDSAETDVSETDQPAELDTEVSDFIKRTRYGRHLYQVRWGVLARSGQERCPGALKADILSALDSNDSPDCEVVKADYVGSLAVNVGEVQVKKEILFENNDEVTNSGGEAVEWTSHIAGHWDGLIIEYIPDENSDEKVLITLSIGDVSDIFTPSEVMGIKEIGNGHYVVVKPLAKALAGVRHEIHDQLVQNKLEVQEEVAKLRELIRRLRLIIAKLNAEAGEAVEDLEATLEEIEAYNFDDTSNAEVEAAINELLGNLGEGTTRDILKNLVKGLKGKVFIIKGKAKVRKFNQKFIPFKDTDDDQWYTDYVSTVKELGIVSGYKDEAGNDLGIFGPGNNVTVAEMLKIGLETSNRGKSDGTPSLAGALNHWARSYVRRAEELGLNLVSDEGTDLNRPATRAEVIRLMLEAIGVDPETVSSTSFSDLPSGHLHAAFVEFAVEQGIVSGDDNATTFRPDAPINRAEVAKISKKVLEYILEQQATQ